MNDDPNGVGADPITIFSGVSTQTADEFSPPPYFAAIRVDQALAEKLLVRMALAQDLFEEYGVMELRFHGDGAVEYYRHPEWSDADGDLLEPLPNQVLDFLDKLGGDLDRAPEHLLAWVLENQQPVVTDGGYLCVDGSSCYWWMYAKYSTARVETTILGKEDLRRLAKGEWYGPE